jgi:hypothetical protein
MRTLCALALALALIVGCGTAAPPADPSSRPDSTPPAGATDPASTGASSLTGCPLAIRRVQVVQAAESVPLPLRGGTTDAASIVLVFAYTNLAGPLTVRYQSGLGDCARATFPSSVNMDDIGAHDGEQGYSGTLPAFRSGTHVCWKLAADVCGTTLTSPSAGEPAFDYTTK